MPHPKRRHSKERGRTRRAHYKAADLTLAACSNCGATKRSHHICMECGHYRGQQVIEIKDKV